MSESPVEPQALAAPDHSEDEHGLPDEAVLRRAEEKPPLYRFFRGGMYVTYMLVVIWFVLGVIFAAYHSVWGPEGRVLQNQEKSANPR